MTDTWTWATVTQASPLRIKVDGDTTPLDATTDNLVGSLAEGDRVRVHLHSDGIIVTGIQGGGNRSNPNLLINSDFMVNQRDAVSGASLTSGAYFLDRWKNVGNFTTSEITWADSGGLRTLTIGAGGTLQYVGQVVEQRNVPAGTYTMSWGGAVQGRIYKSGTTAPALASSPITVTLDGLADANVDLAGGGETVPWVKLEQGPVATPYQPPLYGDNLRACMRYFQVLLDQADQSYVLGFYYTATFLWFVIDFKVTMRAAPTIVATTGTNYYRFTRNGGHNYFDSATSSGGGTTRASLINTTEASGVAGQSGVIRANAVGAKITASSEL